MSRRRRALVAGLVAVSCLLVGQPVHSRQLKGSGAKVDQADACRDSQGGSYSPGATLEIGGKTMECVVGPHWVPAGAEPANVAADVLDVGNANVVADVEAAILKALSGTSLPTLECDTVLNSDGRTEALTRVPAGEKRLLMFWTLTCGPCSRCWPTWRFLPTRSPRVCPCLASLSLPTRNLSHPVNGSC